MRPNFAQEMTTRVSLRRVILEDQAARNKQIHANIGIYEVSVQEIDDLLFLQC